MNKKIEIYEKNSINLSNKFNKIESDLFLDIIKNIKYGTYQLNIRKDFLENKYKLDQNNNWFNFFINFSKKYFIYQITNAITEKIGIIRIIDNFSFSDETFNIIISQNLISVFDDRYNEFKAANFNNILIFKNKTALKLYTFLYEKHISDNIVETKLDDLKKILKINTSYPRFFDFEKHILKKSLKEIKKFKNIDISYSPLKKLNQKKIIGVKFYIKDKLNSLIEESALKFISKIKSDKTDKAQMLKFFKTQISLNGNKYVKNNLDYAILHNLNIYDSVKNDYYNTFFENQVKDLNHIIFSKEEIYSNKEEMIINIIKEIKNLEDKTLILMIDIIDYLIINSEMYKYGRGQNRLYDEIINFINKNNRFEYKDKNYIIISEFNGNMKSRFLVLKNK